MDAPLVKDALVGMGTAGAIISVLMFVIGLMGTAILVMYKNANKIYGYRLKERDILNTALSSATEATRDHSRTMEQRNSALKELADAIKEQSGSMEQLSNLVKMQYDFLTREIDRHSQVINAVSDANRTLTASNSDTRNMLIEVRTTLIENRAGLLKIMEKLERRGNNRTTA